MTKRQRRRDRGRLRTEPPAPPPQLTKKERIILEFNRRQRCRAIRWEKLLIAEKEREQLAWKKGNANTYDQA